MNVYSKFWLNELSKILMLSGHDRKDPRKAPVLSDESLGFPADGSARAILDWVL